ETVAIVSAPCKAWLKSESAGFTSAGIAAGSYAASMMSSAAVANGGGVAAGSVVAALQSAGAAGLTHIFALPIFLCLKTNKNT
uniref:Uncharacterized protein n=1 Tax=Haplochromis burtoni TaxID=8153 RepID=A0A3Q3CQ13_HAPBU